MAKKNFYAVVRGRKPGIYTRWSEAGGAEEQVKGYPGAIYKGFCLRREAEAYLRSTERQLPPEPPVVENSRPEAKEKLQGEVSSEGKKRGRRRGRDAYLAELAAGKVVVFTDGSSIGNPGRGGYGVVMLYGDARKELSAGFRCTTNNRMELLACIVALREIKRPAQVVIYSDSRYVVNAVQKGWARRWQKNEWMRAPDAQGQTFRAENVDLWEQMLGLLEQYQVEFHWVKGHASHPENERCDQLALQAARGHDLPPDTGYRGRC